MQISTLEKIYKTEWTRDMDIDEVLRCIKTGNYRNRDLRNITNQIQSVQDHNEQNTMKFWNLPVAMFNGTFSYKDNDSMTGYSPYTAIDFDGFNSEEELQMTAHRLTITPCVYAAFRTPSGRGLKAIILHDNTDPGCHEELYLQLLAKFEIKGVTDSSVCDLARGHYLCYDPHLWLNANCVPYHFEHDPSYLPRPKSSKSGRSQSVRILKWVLSLKKPVGNKSDESIIAILNSYWKKKPERWKEGNRAKSVFSSASELCKAGVNIDKALDYLVNAYTQAGLVESEILYQALRGYQLNAETYGINRARFDSYGRKRL